MSKEVAPIQIEALTHMALLASYAMYLLKLQSDFDHDSFAEDAITWGNENSEIPMGWARSLVSDAYKALEEDNE